MKSSDLVKFRPNANKKKLNLGILLSKVFAWMIIFGLVLSLLLPLFQTIWVKAAISIEKTPDPKSEAISSYFLFRAKQGEVLQGSVSIKNLSQEDVIYELNTNDATTTTSEGLFTILDNSVENKEVGTWISINKGRKTIRKSGKTDFPFQISVPVETQDGEYAGAISVTEIQNSGSNSVQLGKRSGVRVYTLVGQNFFLNSEIQNLELIRPSDTLKLSGFQTPASDSGQLVFKFDANNQGNIYSLLDGKYEIIEPGGRVVSGSFQRSIEPRGGIISTFISTEAKYRSGKTKLKLEYRFLPENKLLTSKDLKIDENWKQIEAEMETSQQELAAYQTNEIDPFFSQNPLALVFIIFFIFISLSVIVPCLILIKYFWKYSNKV